MITIITDDSKENYSGLIKKALFQYAVKAVIFKANEFNVESCRGCSSCSGKTFGRCILEDDMQKIFPKLVRSEKIVLVSPITYGGVSFNIKKIMDRLASVGDPRYYLKDGELVKKMRIKDLKYYMIGIKEGLSEEENRIFKQLHRENIRIMSVDGKVFTINRQLNNDDMDIIFREICYD